MNTKTACTMARALEGVTEKDHFGSDAFYTKRIFATVWHDEDEVNLRLTPELQEHYVAVDGAAFVVIDNGFGRMGWTTVRMKKVKKDLFEQALKAAWEASAVKRTTKKKKTTTKKARAKR